MALFKGLRHLVRTHKFLLLLSKQSHY